MERIKAGQFYEVNRMKLPPRAPEILHYVRIAMVSTKSEVDHVTIRYPGYESLREFFAAPNSEGLMSLDKSFSLGPELAVEVLGRQISTREFSELRSTRSFWLNDYFRAEELGLPADGGAYYYAKNLQAEEVGLPAGRAADYYSKNVKAEEVGLSTVGVSGYYAKNGACFSTLQNLGMKGWGSRHVVQYGQPVVKQPDDPEEAMSTLSHGDGKQFLGEAESKIHEVKVKELLQYSRKRKRGQPVSYQRKKSKQSLKRKLHLLKPKLEGNKEERIERWSVSRYEVAVKELVEVLKANKAVYGHPIPRSKLRTEARKKIGDTGLLDHLLKHLAGRVVPLGGDQRLRRRCDSEGKMEYWLESADLVNIREEAGVKDPYWTPPPGWKPGDCTTLHNCICCQEVRLLKDQLSSLRRHVKELKYKEENPHAITAILPDNSAASGRLDNSSLYGTNTEVSYELLAKKKAVMEKQLLEMSKALMELEEDMNHVLPKTQAGANQTLLMLTSPKSSSDEEMNGKNQTSTEDLEEETSKDSSESDDHEEDADVGSGSLATQTLKIKLKPCQHSESSSKITSHAVDSSREDISAILVTHASTSPHSTTTS